MRAIRVVVLALVTAVAVGACTNPVGPKPAGDNTSSSNTVTGPASGQGGG